MFPAQRKGAVKTACICASSGIGLVVVRMDDNFVARRLKRGKHLTNHFFLSKKSSFTPYLENPSFFSLMLLPLQPVGRPFTEQQFPLPMMQIWKTDL